MRPSAFLALEDRGLLASGAIDTNRARPGLPSMADAMIEFRGVTARYGSVVANDHLDLTVRRGELMTLLGPSGCGKTTALRTLTGHVRPSEGRVLIDGRDVTDLPTYKREL